jgi:pimeloyl-ACP methyl ester carboxylesterase
LNILRTPEERFAGLPGYKFTPHYLDDLPGYEGLRIHYVEKRPAARGKTFLCLHGQPTWSYLYRSMIPVFAGAGHHVVAPDLPGFGKSDKPVDDAVYTFDFHRNLLLRLIERLDLRDIVLVCQDWGGILGLTLPMEMPERFSGLLVMNTLFPGGDAPLPQGFLDWRAWSNKNPDMAVGKLMSRSVPKLTPAEIAAYDAPFPDARYKAGVRRFPQLVPETMDAPGAELSRWARDWWEKEWRGTSMMAIGMKDPVLGPLVMAGVHRHIRGCPPPMEVIDGGHFVQEWGAPIAHAALEVFSHG